MSRRKSAILFHRTLQSSRVAQVVLLAIVWLLGEAVARLTGIPVPGAVIGLFGMLALLASGVIRLSSMRRGAHVLIADMLLFFVPAVLAVLEHGEFVGLIGLKILAVILVGTVTVMCMTALAVDAGYRVMVAMEHRRAGV